MRTRGIAVATALVLAISGCSGTTSPPATTTAPTEATVPPTITTTTGADIGTDAVTDRPLGQGTLVLMLPDKLPEPWTSYSRQSAAGIDNERAVTLAALDLEDEADDVASYGRIDGARGIFVPRFTTGAVVSLEFWVDLFDDDAGAAGYLDDSVADAGKRLGGGRSGEYVIDEAAVFAIDPVGADTVGVTITERSPTGARVDETVVGFRVGRLLGHVSVARTDGGDARIAAQILAEHLRDRMLGVLDGSVTPVPTDRPALLTSYTYTFEQRFTERYQTVVYPEPSGDDAGFGDDEPGASTSTTSTTDPNAGSTTTTTRVITIDSSARVTSEGVVAGDATECDLTLVLTSGQEQRRYVTAGDRAWMGSADDPVEVSRTTEPAVSDLLFCPGWPVDLAEGGLAEVIVPGSGAAESLDGVVAERFDLDLDDLAVVGIAPPGGSGITLDRFTVWIGGDGPWVVGLELSYRGRTEALEAAIGPGFVPGASVSIAISFRANRLNDPSLTVAVPGDAVD